MITPIPENPLGLSPIFLEYISEKLKEEWLLCGVVSSESEFYQLQLDLRQKQTIGEVKVEIYRVGVFGRGGLVYSQTGKKTGKLLKKAEVWWYASSHGR